MKNIFDPFSNEDFEFDRNIVKVSLSQFVGLLSRSQARRLLFGLEKFRIINLGFSDVAQIGQAFADEIFRVYQKRFPQIRINYENVNKVVEFMIFRVLKGI